MIDTGSSIEKRASIDHLDVRELERLRHAGALLPGDSRPRYFDGRFLAARDLERDQASFFTRQRALTDLAGPGVLAGLHVSAVSETTVAIAPGVGITESGELVVIPDQNASTTAGDPLRVDLSDVPTIQRLSYELGLLDTPTAPVRGLTGVFVLGLRAVQYTANPQGGYPASLTERRAVEDGDVIEAVAITLVPYSDTSAALAPAAQRAQLARSIFLRGQPYGVAADVLPIAMLQLEGGALRWLDVHLVRREIGPEHGGMARPGLRSRAVHEAHVLQYQAQLAALIEQRSADGLGAQFAASEGFAALPAVGTLPAAAVNLVLRSQLWFPPGVQASFANVPEDEIAQLVEESLLLPAIDLQVDARTLRTVVVLILAPRPRFAPPVAAPAPTPPPGPAPRRSGAAAGTLGDIARGGFAAPQPALASDPPPSSTEPLYWYVRCRTQYVLPDAEVVAGSGA